MKRSYLKVALAIWVSCFLTFSIAEAQNAKQANKRTPDTKQTKKPTPQETKQTNKVKVAREGVGFEGIAVGKSTEADVVKKFGKGYKLKTHKKYSYQMVYPGGLSFYICQTDKRRQIFDIELRVPFEAKTSKGISLGKSTLEDIYKIYGKQKDGGLEYRGVSFFYASYKGKKTVTVIDIVENSGIRQCDSLSRKENIK